MSFVSFCPPEMNVFASSGIVGNSAATLLTTIEEMHLLSKRIFFSSLSLHANKLMDKVGPPGSLGHGHANGNYMFGR